MNENNGGGFLNVNLDPKAELNLDGEMQKKSPDEKFKKIQDEHADALGNILFSRWHNWRDEKEHIEDKWMKWLRAYSKIHEPDIAAAIREEGSTDIFIGLTRAKCNSIVARIMEIVDGPEPPWSIDATPIPEMNTGMTYVNPLTMEQEMVPPEIVKELVGESVDKMRETIKDQIIESDFDLALALCVQEMGMLGTGAVKGPIVDITIDKSWHLIIDQETGKQEWDMEFTEHTTPGIRMCSVWDLFPDPYAKNVAESMGTFEQHLLSQHQVRELGRLKGFNKEKINELITWFPNGNYTLYDTEIERRVISGYRRTAGANSGRYQVLEYTGFVDARELQAAGVDMTGKKMDRDYFANVWTCGPSTIRAKLYPTKAQRSPYRFVPYTKKPTEFWGVGPAEDMEDSQRIVNKAFMVLLDNMGIAAFPQVEVNMNLLDDGEDTKIYKGKVWKRNGGDPTTPLLRFYTPPVITDALFKIMDQAKRLTDEETAAPSYTYGVAAAGMTKTASGMGMMMNNANTSLKAVVKNIDNYLFKELIEDMYHFNMQYNPDEEIKHADVKVSTKGATTLIGRDTENQKLLQFLQMTVNEMDIPNVNRVWLLKQLASGLGLDPDKAVPVPENNTPDPNNAMLDPNMGQVQQPSMGQSPQGMGQMPAEQPHDSAGLPPETYETNEGT